VHSHIKKGVGVYWHYQIAQIWKFRIENEVQDSSGFPFPKIVLGAITITIRTATSGISLLKMKFHLEFHYGKWSSRFIWFPISTNSIVTTPNA